MRRVVLGLLALASAACAPGFGGPPDVPLSTAALRATSGASAAQAAAALTEVDSDVALVIAPADPSWFGAVATGSGLRLSGPGYDGDLGLAFYGPEALGDTTIQLTYDGGSFVLQDALYELEGEQFLDLMAFSVAPAAPVRPLVTSLMRYIATDVMANASVVIAIAVPDRDTGDEVSRLLGPGYFDVLRCGDAAPPGEGEILLMYGPEARVWCNGARADRTAAGTRIHASLVAGSP
ncbi:MAG TPA: hypothetical protein VK966_13785 [Longimicrobiales bacterium]|nr:hypothetical protein [Longimicrobiales bacterium]